MSELSTGGADSLTDEQWADLDAQLIESANNETEFVGVRELDAQGRPVTPDPDEDNEGDEKDPHESDGDEAETGEDEEYEQSEPDNGADPVSPAEPDGVTDLDMEIKLPAGEGTETLRLGDVLDELNTFKGKEAQLNDQINEVMRERVLLGQLQAQGGQMTPEQAEQMRVDQDYRLAREAELLRANFPQWEKAETKTEDVAQMLKIAREIGFNEAEVKGNQDHRNIKLLYRVLDAERQLASLKSKQQTAQTNLKKVARTAPKARGERPGAPQTNMAQFDHLVAQAQKNGGHGDWAKMDELLLKL